MTVTAWVIIASAIPTGCGLVGWIMWLRFCRSVITRYGPEAVPHILGVARAYRSSTAIGNAGRLLRQIPAGGGNAPTPGPASVASVASNETTPQGDPPPDSGREPPRTR